VYFFFCCLRCFCTYQGTFHSWCGTFFVKGIVSAGCQPDKTAIFGSISVISGNCKGWRGDCLWLFETGPLYLSVSFGSIFSMQRMFRFFLTNLQVLLIPSLSFSNFFFPRAPRVVNRSLLYLTTQEDHVPEMYRTPCARVKVAFECTCRKDNFNNVKGWFITKRSKMDV